MLKKIRKAVFPVGGLGTRFLPATKSMPKEMLPVASKPLIQHAFEEAAEAGIEQFIFVTGRNKYAISNHFDHAYELEQTLAEKGKDEELERLRSWLPDIGQIAVVRQREPLGLGHAIWSARNLIGNEPFAILLADELFLGKPGVLKQLVQTYEQLEAPANVIAVTDVAKEEVSRYGIITPGAQKQEALFQVNSMVEKPKPVDAPSTLAINGRYILQPEILRLLDQHEKGAGGEIQLTDAMAKLVKTQAFYAFRYDGERFDCGNPLGFLEANIAFALHDDAMSSDVEALLMRYNARLQRLPKYA